MTDRELLEMAAKAMGIEIGPDKLDTPIISIVTADGSWWNPLDDDGDCARMEAALGIDVLWENYVDVPDDDYVVGVWSGDRLDRKHTHCEEPYGDDRNAARRRASVRYAAKLGAAMASTA